jgi:predicted nucleic acid-binding protein
MYLLDTNIWLERLLNQERADEVGLLLDAVPSDQLFMTDFAAYQYLAAEEYGASLVSYDRDFGMVHL